MTVHDGSMEWPNMENYSDIPMYNTKAVVQQTGVPAPTLRAWERRYALISPERAENDYRLYSERDIVLLRWLKERIDDGMSISQAIALFRYLSEGQQQDLTVQGGDLTDKLKEHSPAFQIAVTPPPPRKEPVAEPPLVKQSNGASGRLDWLPAGSEYMFKTYPSAHNMRVVRDHLIDVFQEFNEQAAIVTMGSMFSLYSIEQVCCELIVPTLWQVGQLWAEGKLTVSVEHFASNFFRAVLTNHFHVTPGPLSGPLAIICSAPGEPHELAALMLALFLRRAGLRVAYLGQSIETTGLLHTIKKLRPALICVSLTMPPYLPALINLGRQVQNLPPPRPIFTFGGQAFTQYATIITQIPGCYMQGDLLEVTDKLVNMVLELTGTTS